MHSNSLRALACACVSWLIFVAAAPARVLDPAQPDKLLDLADVRTGWASHATLSVDDTIKVHGAASLKSVGNGKDRFRKAFTTPMDVSGMRYLTFWYYVDAPQALGSGTDHGQIELTSGGIFDNQEQNWSVRDLHLHRGWNYVVLDLPGRPRSGTPTDLTRINYFRIYHNPTSSVTTRIDHITFTNRDPLSSAYSEFLELKRISRSTAAVEQLDGVWGFLTATQSGSAARQKACRKLRIDLTHREVSAASLRKIGVDAAIVESELREKRFLKEYMCGERVWSRAETLARLQSRANTEIAVTAQIASLFDMTMEAAAETKETILGVDLSRIHKTCETNRVQLGAYIDTGVLPPGGIVGMNPLVRNCSGGVNDIASRLGNLEPVINDRRAAYSQCMAAFTSQGSQCDNPYASPDSDYNARVNALPYSESEKNTRKEKMAEQLAEIRDLSIPQARNSVPETHPRPDAPPAQRADLEVLHGQFDQARGKAVLAELAEEDAIFEGNNPPNVVVGDHQTGAFPVDMIHTSEEAWYNAHGADAKRLREEKIEHLKQMLDRLIEICQKDPNDPQCNLADDEWIPGPEEVTVTAERSQRCANMSASAGGGQNVWYNQAPVGGEFRGQINEADRIDHCVCKVFDRGYGASLPGDLVQIPSGCPTPEERVAQECLENPYDGVDGIKRACIHLMQPIALDRDALAARLCQKIRPSCKAPYADLDSGDCGCGTPITQNPVSGTIIPGCPVGIPNCPDGLAAKNGCGCQPFQSGASVCTKGGKDFYLAADPKNDLLVRVFPNKPAYPTEHILVARGGGMRFVTAAFKRDQLVSASQLPLRAVLPGSSYDGTGQIRVSCTNTSTGMRNLLVETFQLAGLSTSDTNNLVINLSSSERNACFGSNPNNQAHFEFFVDTKPNQSVGFFDILGDFGNIKPPCTPFPPHPLPGPRPLDSWPTHWTMSNGTTIPTIFNGTGAVPALPPSGPLFPLCVMDGIIVPCP